MRHILLHIISRFDRDFLPARPCPHKVTHATGEDCQQNWTRER